MMEQTASKKKKLVLLVLAAVVLIVLLLVFGGITGDQLLRKNPKDLVVQSYVTMDENNVNALTGGQVAEVLVQEGDLVEEGQELVRMDEAALNAQREQAEAGLRQAEAAYRSLLNGTTEEQMQQLRLGVQSAEANYESAKANYDKLAADWERTSALLQSGDVSQSSADAQKAALDSAKASMDAAQTSVDIAKSKVEEAVKGATEDQIAQSQAAVDQARAALKQVDASLDKSVLKSPVKGLVTTVNVKNGDVISSGLPAIVVSDIYNPYITCNIDETKLSQVELQQSAQIYLAALGKEAYPGKVVKINKQADFATKKASNEADWDILTYGIKVVFDDPSAIQDTLRAGMTAYVDFGK